MLWSSPADGFGPVATGNLAGPIKDAPRGARLLAGRVGLRADVRFGRNVGARMRPSKLPGKKTIH